MNVYELNEGPLDCFYQYLIEDTLKGTKELHVTDDLVNLIYIDECEYDDIIELYQKLAQGNNLKEILHNNPELFI